MEADLSPEEKYAENRRVSEGREIDCGNVEININEEIRKKFGFPPLDLRSFSPLSLALIGDSIFEHLVRLYLLDQGDRSLKAFNEEKKGIVSAQAQAVFYQKIKSELTNEEAAVFRRGRNAKPKTTAKHASMSAYHTATGLEALFGWLYLRDEKARLLELFYMGIKGAFDLP